MLDDILEMFGRKKTAAGTRQGGIGGLLTRVQDTLEGDDDSRRSTRSSERRFDYDDDGPRDRYEHDGDHDDDRGEYRGRRREREGFDLGD